MNPRHMVLFTDYEQHDHRYDTLELRISYLMSYERHEHTA
jgi:hypothetical protein